MRKLGLLLCLALAAGAGDDPVVQVYDLADLKASDTWWAIALSRVRAAAGDATLRLERGTIVLTAPAAVHERVGKALAEAREGFGKLVTIEIRFARIEGGAGVASVPAEKIEEFLKEKKAETIAAPTLVCRSLERTSVEVVREISYVADFAVERGSVVDPVVETVKEGWTAKLRPVIEGKIVRVAAELSVTETALDGFQTLLAESLVKIQVPESRTHAVTRLLACAPETFIAVDLGGSNVALVRASVR